MGIWVYGYMGIWVYGYMGIWVYGYMGIWVYGYMMGQEEERGVTKTHTLFADNLKVYKEKHQKRYRRMLWGELRNVQNCLQKR